MRRSIGRSIKNRSLIDNRKPQLALSLSPQHLCVGVCVMCVCVCVMCVRRCLFLVMFRCVCVCVLGDLDPWSRWFWSDTQGRVAPGVRRHCQMASCIPPSCLSPAHTHTHTHARGSVIWPHRRPDGMVLILSTCHTSHQRRAVKQV